MVKQYLEGKSSRLGMFRVSVDGKESRLDILE